jgi:hypothetical protein
VLFFDAVVDDADVGNRGIVDDDGGLKTSSSFGKSRSMYANEGCSKHLAGIMIGVWPFRPIVDIVFTDGM